MKVGAQMLVVVNQDRCSGHGRCAASAPEIYELDSDGYCAISELQIVPSAEAAARAGGAACPEGAISVL